MTIEDISLTTLSPTPDKVIIYKFNIESGFSFTCAIAEEIAEAFPNNTVIIIPDDSNLDIYDKEAAIEILKKSLRRLETT